MADGGLVVRGGVAGVVAGVEAMRAAAAELAGLARVLALVAAELTAVGGELGEGGGWLASPPTFARAEASLVAAVAGPDGVLRACVRLEELAAAMAAVAALYAAAEAGAAASVRGAEQVVGSLVGRLVPLVAVPAAGLAAVTTATVLTAPEPVRRGLLGLLAGHPDAVEHVAAMVPGAVEGLVEGLPLPGSVAGLAAVAGAASSGALAGVSWPPREVRDVAGLVGASDRMVGAEDGLPVRVLAGRPLATRPPAGIGGVVSRVAACGTGDGAQSGTATVRVEAVTGADGARSWVVEIPGTSSWSARAGSDPFDATSDLNALGGRPSAAQRSVVAAMEAAGVPPGEPVLLAGHSLGGMVAAGLAADPAFQRRYRVTHLLTIGSPVSSVRVPRQVQVLALQHTDDLVPRLDGRPDPDRSTWVTVSRPATPAGSPPDPALAHRAQTYVATARLVDASDDPSVLAWRRGASGFFDRPGAHGRAVEVHVMRVVGR